MGKKINQADVKKSEKALLIWAAVIVVAVLTIAIGMALSDQTPKSADNTKQPVSSQSNKTTSTSNQQINVQPSEQNGITYAEIQTTKGIIKVTLENKKMPITVGNFTKLVNKGFYNGLTFHRVEDWVIQGGDPSGNGTGGSGETISLETSSDLKNVRGALAMARSNDKNSASSQFYILKKDASWLDGQYAVFGNVVSGMDVVDKMEIGDKMLSIKIIK